MPGNGGDRDRQVERCAVGDAVDLRRLVERVQKRALELGARRMVIQSDPFAEDFYLAMGAIRTGERASRSIPGRVLPLMSLTLQAT